MLSKEQGIVFIISLLAIDFVIHKSLKEKKIWLEKIPFLVIAIIFGWYTLSIQGVTTGEGYPLWQRVLFANYSLWEYILKLTVPHTLSHFYFFPMDPGEAIPFRFWIYPMATIIFVWILIEYNSKINRVFLFGGLFFLINLVLVLHIIPIPRGAIIADRYIYLSSIGFFLILMYGMSQLFLKKKRLARKLTVAAILYIIILGSYTHQRTKAWENMETLNEDVKQMINKYKGGLFIYEDQKH